MRRITSIIGILTVMCCSINDGLTQKLGDKVYWMSTTKHGYKQVATWQTIVGDIEEVIFVAEFENMAAYHKARRSLLGSEEWKTVSKKFGGLNRNIKTRFLSATPYSKLK